MENGKTMDICYKILKMGSFLLLFILFMMPKESVNAAVKKNNILNSYDHASVRVDLDGDGRKERLKLKTEMEYDTYIKKAYLYVNNKKLLNFRNLTNVTSIEADYMKMSNSKIFIRIRLSGDSDNVHLDNFYKYDAHKNKLLKARELLDVQGWCAGATIKSVSSTQIKVLYTRQFVEIGSIQWISSYTVKNGKLKLKSNTANAVSTYAKQYTYDPDGYGNLFQKNKYKAIKSIKLYTDTSLKKVSFSAGRGDILVLKKVKVTKNGYYVQFSKGGKKGWIRLKSYEGEPLFYGISNRLAG